MSGIVRLFLIVGGAACAIGVGVLLGERPPAGYGAATVTLMFGALLIVVGLVLKRRSFPAETTPAPLRPAATIASTPTVSVRSMIATPPLPPPPATGSPRATIAPPRRFAWRKGFLVFYQFDLEKGRTLGTRHFQEICALIETTRTAGGPSGKHAYDVVLMEVPEGSKDWVNLVVTTNDPGARDQNTILSNLFTHNNPKMEGGQVEEINPDVLGNPAYKVIEEAHFRPL